MDLTYISVFLIAALLALILVAPLFTGEMPDHPDQRDDKQK
jgi:hypothetical protein